MLEKRLQQENREDYIEEKIVARLKEKGWQVTCAESCTGGMIASTLVNVAGVSEVFKESYVTYANSAKSKLLGVEEKALETWGAVSRQVAEQMAAGAAQAAAAQASVAVTGIAGPDGGTPEKPVGLVYIGCFAGGNIMVTENHFTGNRLEIRRQTTQAALTLLYHCLMKEQG
ncbi:CinA family protein [Parablautia intestinalis]|uniref:CinA family protein n=1 Tax=Parablautia intestinalis TaxID=2320100 RepID=A0A3A9AI22_9FIRM|nr:CinA family protein [Parablautia intestinalis]RKI91132.1 CinA family protein [Parablautia intestinalis]